MPIRLPDLLASAGRALLSLRYRVTLAGAEEVRKGGTGGILFLPNHPALVDPVVVVCTLYPAFRPRPLADRDQLLGPFARKAAEILRVLVLPDPAKYGRGSAAEVREALSACADALRAGENVVLWPGGRISHGRLEELGANSAVERILSAAPGARVVLVRTRGLWGSSFSRAGGFRPDFNATLLAGLRHLLANALFFTPRREVSLELWEPPSLPLAEGRLAVNRFLERFYNLDAPPALRVPYRWREGAAPVPVPEPAAAAEVGAGPSVPAELRERVAAKIRSLSGLSPEVTERTLLAEELGLDSLARLELCEWIGEEFGRPAEESDRLRTAGDAFLAASGELPPLPASAPPLPPAWFAPSTRDVAVPPGGTVTEVFLAQAARDPSRPILADSVSGVLSYRDAVTAVLALRPALSALPGRRVGLLLPASAGACVAWLALLFAGKVPVLVNWTTGIRGIRHGLDSLGVEKVVTSSALLAKLARQGTDLSALGDRLLPLEEVRRGIGAAAKVAAALESRLSWRSLRRAVPADTAAVLFTSGSEALPKAVPLSHGNLLANVRAVTEAYALRRDDRLLGILPPFHSFGLTVTSLLPLVSGLRCAFHPNPTEGASVARLCGAYRITLLVGTPAFLAAAAKAASDGDLSSLRLVITGAEKCPDRLHDRLAARWPRLEVLEGYGVTECSPVVSANRIGRSRRGTIGVPLPGVEVALVHPATGEAVAEGEAGVLLVRGESVFSGYLDAGGAPAGGGGEGGAASPFQEHGGATWYRTGDLVRRDPATGHLVFAGRMKRFVKVGGEMVSLPAVEEALAEFLGGEEEEGGAPRFAVAALDPPEGEGGAAELVLASVVDLSREEANGAIRAAGLSPLHFVRRVVRVERIPLLGTGKADHRALEAMLRER